MTGPDHERVAAAAAWLAAGGIVAFPTDTVYGLAVDPRSARAVAALFDLKGRGADAALPLIAGSRAQVDACCGALAGDTARLADRFWPGPLSLVMDAPPAIVTTVHAGGGTVAVRVPALAMARAIAEAFGYLVTATSANRSGEPAATSAAGLGSIGADARVFVLDGGNAPAGAPSTIVDARSTPPRLVRAGAIAWNRVLESLQE